MSLRPPVSRDRIDAFLRQLGERYPRPARLYLVGGTSIVFEGFRQQTLDIDIVIEVSADHHGELIRVLRDIKNKLPVNVEEVSPADFIPLPAGYESRHEYLGRYGQVDVFHFEWLSTGGQA